MRIPPAPTATPESTIPRAGCTSPDDCCHPQERRLALSLARDFGGLAALVGLLLVAGGCASSGGKTPAERVDAEAYEILHAKSAEVHGDARDASIATAYTGRDPADIVAEELIADRARAETVELNLHETLRLATAHSRDYQTQREALYLSALALSNERHRYDAKFGFGGQVAAERQADADVTVGANTDASASKLLESGGDFGLSLANDLLRYTNGDPRASAISVLSFHFTQPLLRGAGKAIATENLTQSERDVIYAVRDFARFQQTFAVGVAGQYYRLLQQKDTVRNEYNNYRNLVLQRQRAEALSVDRLPAFQVDQTRQDELSARNRYILAVDSYLTALDNLKELLGLPLGAHVRLDDTDLRSLSDAGPQALNVPENVAMEAALAHRFDLLNEVDKFDDAKRKIDVAENALKSNVSVFTNASLTSNGPAKIADFDPDNYRIEAGLKFDLALDRLNERNTYRRRLIEFERQLRQVGLRLDSVRDDLRGASRTLDQAAKRYAIQRNAVALAERRVESANLLLQAGRAETRDLLDAQSSLLGARNALTQVLVDHHLARLALLRDMGLLAVSTDGLAEDGELAVLLQQNGIDAGAANALPPVDDAVAPPDDFFNN